MERISNLSKIFVIITSLVIIFNCITFFVNSEDFLYLLKYVIPFICLLFLLIFYRKVFLNEWLLFLCALGVAMMGQQGNFSGATFMIFSFMIYSSRNRNIIKLSIFLLALVVKSLIININISQFVNLLLLNSAVIVVYFVIPKKTMEKPIDIDDQVLQIINYKLRGLTYKEISELVFIKVPAIHKQIDRERKKLNCRSRQDLFDLVRQNYKKLDKNKDV